MWRKFLFTVLLCSLMLCILLGYPLTARAASGDFSDTYYFGSAVNSYRQFNSSGYIIYEYPQGTLCFKMNYFDTQYVCIACRRDMLVNNGSNVWGLYRSISNYNTGGNFSSGTPSAFFQMEGYSSDNFVTIDGVEYVIRTMVIDTVIDSCPYFFARSDRSAGARAALEGYITGIKLCQKKEGGGNGGSISEVDLAGIQNSLDVNNSTLDVISNDLVLVKESVAQNVGSAFDSESKELLVAIRYVLGALFIVTCGFGFRNILLSWRRNTVK